MIQATTLTLDRKDSLILVQEGPVVTLRSAWEEYKRIRTLSRRTLRSYESHLSNHLSDWMDIPIAQITKSMVFAKSDKLKGMDYSGASVNGILRTARALIEFAIHRYDLPINNPVKALSKLKGWQHENRRTSHLADHQFRPWFNAVQNLRNGTARDFISFLALTGLRCQEAAELKWSTVDLINGTFVIEETKNLEPLRLPLSDYCWQMLRRRRQWQAKPNDVYAFPQKPWRDKPINIRSLNAIDDIHKESGIMINPHDLRRGYLTIGDSLNIQLHILKRLANHKQSQDITLRYIQTDVERLREPCNTIANEIMKRWMTQEKKKELQSPLELIDTSAIVRDYLLLRLWLQTAKADEEIEPIADEFPGRVPAELLKSMIATGLKITLLDAWTHYASITKLAPGWRAKLNAMLESDQLVAPLVLFPIQAITSNHLKSLFAKMVNRDGAELAKTKLRAIDNLIEFAFEQYSLPGKPATWRAPSHLLEPRSGQTLGRQLAGLYKNGSTDQIRRYAQLMAGLASDDPERSADAYRLLLSE